MMIGIAALDARPQQPAHLETVDEREIQIEQDEAGRGFHNRLECRGSGGHHFHFELAPAFESVFHEPGDVRLVLDNQHPRLAQLGHR
jgi:hypothetical protein